MPVYEYECKSCGERFDVLQKLSDPPVTVCSLCGGAVRKLLGTPALQFKGTGWYITDYAGKSPTPAGSGEAKEKPASPASGEPKAAPEKKEAPACACPSKGCGSSGK